MADTPLTDQLRSPKPPSNVETVVSLLRHGPHYNLTTTASIDTSPHLQPQTLSPNPSIPETVVLSPLSRSPSPTIQLRSSPDLTDNIYHAYPRGSLSRIPLPSTQPPLSPSPLWALASPYPSPFIAPSLIPSTDLLACLSRVYASQILLGFIAVTDRPKPDVLQTVPRLMSAGMRFVYFSRQSERETHAFGRSLGLFTGFNHYISLRDPYFTHTQDRFQGRSMLPRGVRAIRSHLDHVDDVPLLLSLYADATPTTASQMLRVYHEHAETVAVVASSLSSSLLPCLLQADLAFTMDPLLPRRCRHAGTSLLADAAAENSQSRSHTHDADATASDAGTNADAGVGVGAGVGGFGGGCTACLSEFGEYGFSDEDYTRAVIGMHAGVGMGMGWDAREWLDEEAEAEVEVKRSEGQQQEQQQHPIQHPHPHAHAPASSHLSTFEFAASTAITSSAASLRLPASADFTDFPAVVCIARTLSRNARVTLSFIAFELVTLSVICILAHIIHLPLPFPPSTLLLLCLVICPIMAFPLLLRPRTHNQMQNLAGKRHYALRSREYQRRWAMKWLWLGLPIVVMVLVILVVLCLCVDVDIAVNVPTGGVVTTGVTVMSNVSVLSDIPVVSLAIPLQWLYLWPSQSLSLLFTPPPPSASAPIALELPRAAVTASTANHPSVAVTQLITQIALVLGLTIALALYVPSPSLNQGQNSNLPSSSPNSRASGGRYGAAKTPSIGGRWGACRQLGFAGVIAPIVSIVLLLLLSTRALIDVDHYITDGQRWMLWLLIPAVIVPILWQCTAGAAAQRWIQMETEADEKLAILEFNTQLGMHSPVGN